MWKPGQIVTVKDIVCRVVKDKFPSCWDCVFNPIRFNSQQCPCLKCLSVGGDFKLPDDCHLEEICKKEK